MSRSIVSLIERKKDGGVLSAEEIDALCGGFASSSIPDYQVSAWLMAVCCRGMAEEETLALTAAMVRSGEQLTWDGLDRPTVDKHSTGGVGDKTSIVLVPLMAAAGAAFVKMSGRGLGHTGGTLDKLESIPGFRVELGIDEMRAQVARIGCALVGQNPKLVPVDGRLYALRDVTGTVASVPLIASSVMSKKLAAGAGSIVLDVKWGVGSFMRTREAALELARAMVRIGEGAGRRTRALLSPMQEPLGRAIGNALEIREAVDALRGGGPEDLRALTLELGATLLRLAGLSPSAEEARRTLTELLRTGAAAEAFSALVEAQGGDPSVLDRPDRLPAAPIVRELRAEISEGAWIHGVDARGVAEGGLELGAGRRVKSDAVDPAVGIVLRRKTGDRIEPGEPLAEIHARTEASAREAAMRLRAAFRLSADAPPRPVDAAEWVTA